MNPNIDLEERLRTAVQAHAAGVQTDDGSLDVIRTRVRAARRRRRAVLAGAGVAAVVALAVVVPRLGNDGRVSTSDQPAPTTTTVEPPSTTTPPTTPATPSTTVSPAPPAADLDQAMWPDPAGSARYADPVDAARSFVEGFFAVDAPLSEFRAGEPGVGEVDVFSRDENGQASGRVATTLSLRQLDGQYWWVTAAASASVHIDSPQPLADVSPPLRVSGRGSGFEGTVIVEVRDRSGSYGELGEGVTIAGAGEVLEPFSVDVDFDRPASSYGIVVAQTDSGLSGVLSGVTAFPVRFSTGSTDGTPAGSNGDSGSEFRYQPLWPFLTQADADAWREQNRSQGSQPWHLDAEQTAWSFTTGFLGFGEIDRVVTSDIRDREAWVSMGFVSDSGGLSTAAVVHLVRFGDGDDAPWEVVGTRDTDLTLETPRYGSGVTSPITVGGRITGVDENLRVQVRQSSSEAPIGASCCLPAGGVGTPWQTTVSFSGATDPALTIVVSTGGHIQGVERFAITGVRP